MAPWPAWSRRPREGVDAHCSGGPAALSQARKGPPPLEEERAALACAERRAARAARPHTPRHVQATPHNAKGGKASKERTSEAVFPETTQWESAMLSEEYA